MEAKESAAMTKEHEQAPVGDGGPGADDPDAPALPFDEWAEIAAEMLQRSAAERAAILERRSLTPEVWTPCDAFWTAVLVDEITAGESKLSGVYALRCAEAWKARSGQAAPGAADERPVPAVGASPPAASAAASPPLPEAPEEAPPPGPAPPSRDAVAAQEPPRPAPLPSFLQARPGGAPAAPAAAPPPRVEPPPKLANPLQGTSLSLDIPRGAALPFAEGVPAAIAIQSAEQHAAAVQPPAAPGHGLAETAPLAGLQDLVRKIMPFGVPDSSAPPASAPPAGVAPPQPPVVVRPPAAAPQPPVVVRPPAAAPQPPVVVRPPAAAPARPHRAEPEFPLETYASLCAELDMDPGRAAEILHRYGVQPDQRARLDVVWAARLRADPALGAAFQHAKTVYETWLRSRRTGPA